MKGLIAVIVAVWAYRYVATILNFREDYIFYVFETRADALAIGCLLAIANRENRIPRWLIDWKWVGALVFAVICACCIPGLSGPLYAWAIGAVAFAIALIQSITYSKSFVYRWLESRPMRALGLISYSLYLYHPLAQQLPRNLMMRPLFQVAFSITLATASYLIVERPFLALKGRMPQVSRPVAAVAEQ